MTVGVFSLDVITDPNLSLNADSNSESLITYDSKIQFNNVNAYSTSHLYNTIEDSSQAYNSISDIPASLSHKSNSTFESCPGALYQNHICSSIYQSIASNLTFQSAA
jgi:hypothetical protein